MGATISFRAVFSLLFGQKENLANAMFTRLFVVFDKKVSSRLIISLIKCIAVISPFVYYFVSYVFVTLLVL